MAWNQESRGHEMVYLASGIAIGAIGASLVLSDNGARRKLTQAMGMEAPKPSGFLWPWGGAHRRRRGGRRPGERRSGNRAIHQNRHDVMTARRLK